MITYLQKAGFNNIEQVSMTIIGEVNMDYNAIHWGLMRPLHCINESSASLASRQAQPNAQNCY